MTDFLTRLTELVGTDAAATLLAEFGGRTVYIAKPGAPHGINADNPAIAELSSHEVNERALGVLQLLSGLRVGQVQEVCDAARGLASNYTRFDISQPLWQQAVAVHRRAYAESGLPPVAHISRQSL